MITKSLPAAHPESIADAAAILADGGLVALPTETVYGLAADATNPDAVAKIYHAKGRPSSNPLIVHIATQAEAAGLALWSEAAERLAATFWPGPLTLVLPARPSMLAPAIRAGRQSVALRMPAHPLARAVIAALGRPVAAPSANLSGKISPTQPAHVWAGLSGRIDAVLEAGACDAGLESTILALDEAGTPRLLREGVITADQIAACLGVSPSQPHAMPDVLEAPGQMASHYAPNAALRLNAVQAEPGEVLLGFGQITGDETLSAAGDLAEAAAGLYAALHRLDARNPTRIAVAPIPETGLGAAINDRLRRAAAPRP